MQIIANNRKASHEYVLHDTYECGLVLHGTEIKSIREGKVNIRDAYALIRNEQAYIINMHIGKYKQGNQFNHDETRTRKLLLHKKEIIKIQNKVNQEAMALVPLKVYMKEGLCKIEIALGKGKKQYDKRQSLKEKDTKKRLDKVMKDARY